MNPGDSTISGGVYAAWIVGGIAVVLLLVTIALVIAWWNDDSGYGMWGAGALFTGVVGLIAGVGVAVGMYPYSAQYHHWTVVRGEVSVVNSRILGDGDSVNQRFVVHLKGIGDRACDDTRCSTVKVGDVLTLTCKREWQYSGTDGWSCNWVGIRRAA